MTNRIASSWYVIVVAVAGGIGIACAGQGPTTSTERVQLSAHSESGGDGGGDCSTLWDDCSSDDSYDTPSDDWGDNFCGTNGVGGPCGTRVTTHDVCTQWQITQGGVTIGFTPTMPSGTVSGDLTYSCSTRVTTKDSVTLIWDY